MTTNNNKDWWEQELPEIERKLKLWLSEYLPTRIADHDDLINETMMSISLWVKKNRDAPGSRFTGSDVSNKDRNAFYKLAKVILRRRIADLYRLDARYWGRLIRAEKAMIDELPSNEPSAEHRALIRQMLKITITVISSLKPEERDVIAIAACGGRTSRALNGVERQRLRRARRKIAQEIISELGESVSKLLSIE